MIRLIAASSFLVFGLYVTDILPPFLKIVDNPDLPYGELEEATIELAGGHAWAYPALWVSTVAFCWEIWGQLSGKGKEA